jgi:serine/threonine protein phosphatase PrpC
MPLVIHAGHATSAGLCERNEDFVGMVTPNDPELSRKGLIAAIADGVSGSAGGREAAEYSVRGLLSDYYATPDTWPVTKALDKVLQATNSWVQHQGTISPALQGMASTLTCVVLRGNSYYFAHVGDTRLYLLRNQVLTRLTTDHVWDRPEMQHVLTRAMGLDTHLTLDQGMGELRLQDVFLLVSDGVWGSLKEYDLQAALLDMLANTLPASATLAASAEASGHANTQCAEKLIQAALAAGARDNVSALVLHVAALPEKNLRDALTDSQNLPLPPKLKYGQTIDGYVIETLIHSSKTTLVYRVVDPRLPFSAQNKMVLKTLHPDCADDARERSAFAHEEWLAKRAVARFFPQVITPAHKNYLYYLTTWHAGHTFAQRLEMGQHFTVPDVITQGVRLVRAVAALHRRSIIHRDIKPDNIHLGDDGELRLLDFGVAQSGLEADGGGAANASGADAPRATLAGTPSFLAPEQFNNAPASPQTDLYAVGVTLYLILTRKYPYGEVEPFQKPRFGDPVPAGRYRPDIPLWLENVLQKAVARDPALRFETAEEFLLALERGGVQPLPTVAATPLLQRDPMAAMKVALVLSVVVNLLLGYLLMLR